MYPYFLYLHSWLRWVIILLLTFTLLNSLYSLINQRPYAKSDRTLSVFLLACVHLQFLGGLLLYFFLSPLVNESFSHFKEALKDHILRYWTIEHSVGMFLFVVFIQLGYSISKRASTAAKKHRMVVIFSTLSFLVLIALLPWPHKEYGRALFRLYL